MPNIFTNSKLTLTLDANQNGRDFIIGDLHGMFEMLQAELAAVEFDKTKDRLFCVGDLIDRGPDSMKCLSLLEEPWFYSVQGNHERMMLAWRDIDYGYSDYHTPYDFIRNGGDWILAVEKQQPELIAKYAELVYQLPLVIHVRDKFKVTHAYLNTQARDKEGFVWDRKFYYAIEKYARENPDIAQDMREQTNKVWLLNKFNPKQVPVYVGHNTVLNGHIIVVDNHVMLDTGAYKVSRFPNEGFRLTMIEHDLMEPFWLGNHVW